MGNLYIHIYIYIYIYIHYIYSSPMSLTISNPKSQPTSIFSEGTMCRKALITTHTISKIPGGKPDFSILALAISYPKSDNGMEKG